MAETIIEIAGPNNESVVFDPVGQRLRGRWSHVATAGHTIHESLAALQRAAPEIPGIYIALDPQARTARVFDPLKETEEGQRIWSLIQPVLTTYEAFLNNGRPWDTQVYENLTPDQVKTWAFEIRNVLDCGYGRMVSGPEPPPLATIKAMPGGRFVRSYMGQRENERVDVVPIEKNGKQKQQQAAGQQQAQPQASGSAGAPGDQ